MAKVKEAENTKQAEENNSHTEQSKASSSKADDSQQKKPKKKKGKGKLIVLFFLIIIIGFIVSVIGFNAFNLREKYLRKTIDKIPVVKDLLKAPVTEDDIKEPTSEEMKATIASLEKEIESQNEKINTLTENNNSLQLENARLKEIESQQVKFKEDKAKFDEMIANNDPTAYSSFYEQISKENAENLYEEAKASAEQTKELKKYTETFNTIDATAGAKIIEEMVGTDMNLASLILKNIDNEQRAKILAEMDATKAASVVKYMAPNNN